MMHMSDLIDRQREVEHLRKIIEATNPESDYNEGWIDGLEYCISTMSVAPSAQPEINPADIDYYYCSNAMPKMWIDNVLTDGEYNKIMDKLNDFERRRREKENG